MPFSGGGGGTLQNHVHNAVPLQGGPLDFSNNTIAGMAAGDITYSDGNALQILNAPGVPAGEVLTFAPAATAPSWVAAGGGAMTLLNSQTFTGSSTLTIDYTPVGGLDATDYQWLLIQFTGDNLNNNVSACYFRLNTGLTASNYYQNGTETATGTTTIVNKNPWGGTDDFIRLTDALANAGSDTWNQEVWLMLPYAAQDRTTLRYSGASPSRYYAGAGQVTGLSGSVDKISYEIQAAAAARDMQFTVYGVSF
jgi:hypothetical protein